MTQSNETGAAELHVAIIMDGNGRWAQARGLPRLEGHRKGADAVRRTMESALEFGLGTLTLYAFSSDNWKRPPEEVSGLFRLLETYLERETVRCRKEGIRITVIGRRDRLTPRLVRRIERTEALTAACGRLHVRVAIDYSARDRMLEAMRRCSTRRTFTPEAFASALGAACGGAQPAPDVDLLIRTSGEQRLSDFLLWECAYAELYFTPRLWPDFSKADLEQAIREFRSRSRRYGGLALPA